MTEPSGVLLLDKRAGATSHDMINKIRRLYGTKRVGHTGTLDPMATGVLVVMIGRAAKAAEFLSSHDKMYAAHMLLGLETDTEDVTGNKIAEYDGIFPDEAAVVRACAAFTGEIEQIPPMYSAVKINGRKLCDLARKNIEVERKPRAVTVYALDAKKVADDEYSLTVKCSSGTYIRTLCADIGKTLGCGATMKSLRRTECGPFSIDNAYTIGQLENMSEDERLSVLMPTEKLFSDIPSVRLPEFFEHLAHCGQEIYQKKIGTDFPLDTYVSFYGGDGFFALGQVRDYPDGTAIKPVRLFVL